MFESDADAAAALAAANESGQVAPAPSETSSEQATAPAPEIGTVEQGGATPAAPEDTFTNIDQLPPELQPLAKQLQGDYTRKTQEVAEYRRALSEYGMTPEDAASALGFVQALQDPEQLRALYEHLGSQFSDGGFDPAATGVEDFGSEPQQGFEDDPRDKQLAELQARLDRFEQSQVEAAANAELDRMEAIIRQQNPNFGDGEMQAIARLAIAHGGNLLQGAEDFKALQQQIISAHVGTKAAVPAGVTGLPATGGAETPTKFNSLDEAHKAALQMLAQDLAQ